MESIEDATYDPLNTLLIFYFSDGSCCGLEGSPSDQLISLYSAGDFVHFSFSVQACSEVVKLLTKPIEEIVYTEVFETNKGKENIGCKIYRPILVNHSLKSDLKNTPVKKYTFSSTRYKLTGLHEYSEVEV